MMATLHECQSNGAGDVIPEVLVPGSYRFPFALPLPQFILPSFCKRPTAFRCRLSKREYSMCSLPQRERATDVTDVEWHQSCMELSMSSFGSI
jgi:hypothetical protein